jgi:hypothetical protein
VEWLRKNGGSLLNTRFQVPPTVLLESVDETSDEGWRTTVRRLHRTDGPGWQHEIDELAARLLAGCQGVLPLEDLLGLLAAAQGLPTEELSAAALPMVRELVRHGMLVPSPR